MGYLHKAFVVAACLSLSMGLRMVEPTQSEDGQVDQTRDKPKGLPDQVKEPTGSGPFVPEEQLDDIKAKMKEIRQKLEGATSKAENNKLREELKKLRKSKKAEGKTEGEAGVVNDVAKKGKKGGGKGKEGKENNKDMREHVKCVVEELETKGGVSFLEGVCGADVVDPEHREPPSDEEDRVYFRKPDEADDDDDEDDEGVDKHSDDDDDDEDDESVDKHEDDDEDDVDKHDDDKEEQRKAWRKMKKECAEKILGDLTNAKEQTCGADLSLRMVREAVKRVIRKTRSESKKLRAKNAKKCVKDEVEKLRETMKTQVTATCQKLKNSAPKPQTEDKDIDEGRKEREDREACRDAICKVVDELRDEDANENAQGDNGEVEIARGIAHCFPKDVFEKNVPCAFIQPVIDLTVENPEEQAQKEDRAMQSQLRELLAAKNKNQ